MPKIDHTTSMSNDYALGSRAVLNEVSSILAEHYGIKLVSLISLIKEKNKLLPKEHRMSMSEVARAMYGKTGKRQQIEFLVQKYGGSK